MPLPARIGKYDIVDMIERGGMGVVYKAQDSVLGRMVALKVMTAGLADSSDSRERFLREARAVSMLQHANIVVVHELGEHDGNPYIVMEFLDGEPLHRVIYEHTPLSVLQKIDIILQVARALQYAHEKGIIHRDIKPGNIILMRDGTVKVVDFGLAHLAGSNTITRTGMLVGTVSFMSPEQLNGEPADARTDIFSLGIVFYLLLTGKSPFEGISTAETITRILFEPPPRLEHFASAGQPELQPVLDKALAKKKEARYQSCSEMSESLSRLRKKYEAEAQLSELEQERKALLAKLGTLGPDAATLVLQVSPPTKTAEPQSPPPPPPQAISTAERPKQASSDEPPAPPARALAEPANKARGGGLKLIVAGLAVLLAAGILYPRLTRSRNPQPPAAVSAPAAAPPIPASPGDNVSPPLSASGTSSSQVAPTTTSSPASSRATSPPRPPIATPAVASSEVGASAAKLSKGPSPSATAKPSAPQKNSLSSPYSENAPSSQPTSSSTTLTPQEMNRRGLQAFQRKDYAQAISWYSKAADQGLARAQNELGQCYLLGQGVPQDYKLATECFRKSGDQGNPFGEHQLGLMYLRGWGGLPRDYSQAVQWFRKSADQNLPIGQFSLGNMYLNGWGLPQDYGLALQWFRKAADQGNPRAQQQLGVMYQNGLGVPKDAIQSRYWFDKAKAAANQPQ